MSAETPGERIFRVLSLDGDVFDEVATDDRETGPALLVVFAVALAAGLGRLPGEGFYGLLLGTLESVLAWGLWLGAIHLAFLWLGRGDRLAPLFRALGFAAAPFGLALVEQLPWFGGVVEVAKWVFGFAAAWRATQRAGGLALPEAGVVCFSALFTALWLSSVLLSVFVR